MKNERASDSTIPPHPEPMQPPDPLDLSRWELDPLPEYIPGNDDVPSYVICEGTALSASISRESPRSPGGAKVLSDYVALAKPRHATAATTAVSQAMTLMKRHHPNFAAVLDDLATYFAAQKVAGKYAHFAPILLVGPPGIGKTHFVNTLAAVMGVPAKFFNLAGMGDNLKFRGMSQSWGQSKPGELAKFLAFESAQVFNPIVVLDELDKCGSMFRAGSSPIHDTLLALTEKESAAQFEDDYIGAPMNLTGISWIATCNTVDEAVLPPPLLSRFDVYHIEPLTLEQQRGVIRTLYLTIRKESGFHKLAEYVPDFAIDAFIDLDVSMRELKRVIYRAECKAIARATDGEKAVLDHTDISIRKNESAARGIGFNANM